MKLGLLVTGFLGSGKTTFILNSIVSMYKDKKLGILVNDFGKIGYDKLLYYTRELRVQGIDGRCVCCEGGATLLQALHSFQDVDILIVETSGLSNPYPIMHAMESSGWVSHITICVVAADSWQDFQEEGLFRAQLEYADCIIISRCDLLPVGIPKKLIDMFQNKPWFLSHEGKVQEEFFLFLHADSTYVKQLSGKHAEHITTANNVQKKFHQYTLKVEGYVSMHDFEKFLRSLPKNIVRVKGVLNCVESPLPMGINWTPRHMCWEYIETSIDSFLSFIYYDSFEIPPIPIYSEPDLWKTIPIGDFDMREGLAYVNGTPRNEICALEYVLQQNIEDFVLVALPENPVHTLKLKKKVYINPSPQNILYFSTNLIRNYDNIILWLIPDAYASYVIDRAKGNKIIHIGKNYLLPKAFVSIRVDTQKKLKAIETILREAAKVS